MKLPDKIICIKVGKVRRETLYEMTRKYWIVNLERASQATYVFAVIKGIVVMVYIPEYWKHSEDEGKERKCEFVGREDPCSKYIGMNVAHLYGKSQNAIKYINM